MCWWSEDNLICDSDIWENEGLKFEKKISFRYDEYAFVPFYQSKFINMLIIIKPILM